VVDLAPLARSLVGRVLSPEDDGYAAACTGFNLAIVPHPDVVACVANADDVVTAVRFARDAALPVRVIATGHGAHQVPPGGLLIDVRALDAVRVDASARTATLGGGTRWAPIVAAAAEHGLAPVTGSATGVGAVGFLLGGGFGPMARRFGAGSDYLVSLRVVTGAGELVTASPEENPDLFWALRGGKGGLGVVVDATVRLVELSKVYGGTLFYDVSDAATVLEGWLDWSEELDPLVTTSASIMRFPDVEQLPPPLRGRHLAAIRLAAPVDAAAGERIAAPVRALAPVVADALGPLAPADVARISNDPTDPMPGWGRGFMLSGAGGDFVRALLGQVGQGTEAPFVGIEVRKMAGAIARDVPGGSPVGGRENPFAVNVVGVPDPTLFDTVLPGAYAQLRGALAEWIAPTTTINWLSEPNDPVQFRSAWSPEAFERLAQVRRRYDPDGILAYGPEAAAV
jgi:FAD/FMN-containing dehydrogenase